jgi:protein-S-isoprenylcysteine O-methyltransferase Ste14
VAVGLLAVGTGRKIEEGLLGQHFGAEYASYKKQVKAIIPFIL